MSTIDRDREGCGHILVLKIKVPASFNQLLSEHRDSPRTTLTFFFNFPGGHYYAASIS
jgi:hypothetical protein